MDTYQTIAELNSFINWNNNYDLSAAIDNAVRKLMTLQAENDKLATELQQFKSECGSPWQARSYKWFFDSVTALGCCNNCGNHNCGIRPGWGEPVRRNCPKWFSSEEEISSANA